MIKRGELLGFERWRDIKSKEDKWLFCNTLFSAEFLLLSKNFKIDRTALKSGAQRANRMLNALPSGSHKSKTITLPTVTKWLKPNSIWCRPSSVWGRFSIAWNPSAALIFRKYSCLPSPNRQSHTSFYTLRKDLRPQPYCWNLWYIYLPKNSTRCPFQHDILPSQA